MYISDTFPTLYTVRQNTSWNVPMFSSVQSLFLRRQFYKSVQDYHEIHVSCTCLAGAWCLIILQNRNKSDWNLHHKGFSPFYFVHIFPLVLIFHEILYLLFHPGLVYLVTFYYKIQPVNMKTNSEYKCWDEEYKCWDDPNNKFGDDPNNDKQSVEVLSKSIWRKVVICIDNYRWNWRWMMIINATLNAISDTISIGVWIFRYSINNTFFFSSNSFFHLLT
jgi:hypothetical protein